MRRFYRVVICTRAATMVEYAIMLSLIAAIALGAVMMAGSRVSSGFQSVNCAAFAASCSAAGGSGSAGGGHGHHGHHGNHGGGNHGNHGKH